MNIKIIHYISNIFLVLTLNPYIRYITSVITH